MGKYCFLTSTKATVSSMASSVTASTVATEASRATGSLTVVSSTETTSEPGQELLVRHYGTDFMTGQQNEVQQWLKPRVI